MDKINLKKENKPNLSKIYPGFIETLARTLDYGDAKYGVGNWRQYKNINELTSAMLRHINRFNSGEVLDSESGLPHLIHVAANTMILTWLLDNTVVDIKDLYYAENKGESI